MKVEQSKVTKLQITEVESLDSLHVFVEDIGISQGKITMETSSESWSAYWGGCGSSGVVDFFLRCNNSYLVNCFSRGISSTVTDYDSLDEWFKKAIIKTRKEGLCSKEEALSQWNSVDLWCCNEESFLHTDRGRELANEIIGDDWHFDLPQCESGEYIYLERVVQAIREAFTELNIKVAA
jgi:hypothetical protein